MQLSNGRIQKPGNDTLLIHMPSAKENGISECPQLEAKGCE